MTGPVLYSESSTNGAGFYDYFDAKPTTPANGLPIVINGGAGDTPWGLKALGDECARVAASAKGVRDDTINAAAFRMGQIIGGGYLTTDTASEALNNAGRACGQPEHEIARALRRDPTGGFANGALSPRGPEPREELTPGTVLGPIEAEPVPESTASTRAALDAKFIDRDGLNHLPTPEPMIEKVLPRHTYGILRGRDQSFKSFVGLDWALCLATGRPWQEHQSQRVRVLYIAGEGAHGLAKRVDAWESRNATAVPIGAFTIRTEALNMFKPNAAYPHLLDWIGNGEYGFVVVDTLRRVSGSADGNGSEMGAVVDNLDRIKRATLNGTVLAIAHTGKDDKDTRGYSGIEDDADVVWEAKRDDSLLVLRNSKQKDGPEHEPIHLRAREVLDSLVLEGSEKVVATTTEAQTAILIAMRQAFRDGVHSTPLMATSGLPQSTFYRALGDLVSAGHLVKSGAAQKPFFTLLAEEQK